MEIPDFGSSLVDVAARTAIIYVVLVVGLRLAGKREVGQLSIFDLIVLLVIADAVQNAMVGENTTLAGGIVAAVTLISLDRLLDIVSSRSQRVRKLLEGEPQVLVEDGVILEDALRKEGLDRDKLASALRGHGIREASEAALVVLETNGSISVIPKDGSSGASSKGQSPARAV